MPDYCFDPARLRLIVHILAPGAGGEFTFCGLSLDGDRETGCFTPLQ